ncbi:MAG: GGDEF domain-containing protein [Gammaproteobacteria bacterium]|nr:MAG: GGDEF domain-containing protein [Gammaproteobacteria bacterium]RLA60617.1 MAG: GGDEF domain-containing protein [Gammaproteobacteria bacterium]
MTVAGKINILFISAAIFLGCVLTGYTAHHEYQADLDQLVQGSLAKVLSRPDLPVDIYHQNETRLTQILGEFLEPAAVTVAVAYNSDGEILARRDRANASPHNLPPFATVRANVAIVEPGLMGLGPERDPVGTGYWSSLISGESLIHLTMPVFSPVNPTQKNLTTLDFVTALSGPGAQNSLVVIGYIHLGIDRKQLLHGIRPAVSRVFYGCLVLILLCAVAVFLMTRRITEPLSQLAKLADQVASGEHREYVQIKGGKEFKEIAAVLNGVIGGVTSYKKEIEVDRKLLSWKVDESTSKLSMRDEELHKAADEITETKGQLHQMAYYDSLTSLPNRRLFTEQLSLLLRLNERNGKPLALLFIDLDNFKRINDSLGHSAGDLLLREVGKRLLGCLRSSDILTHYVESGPRIDVSRLGGDEFTVVLNQLDSIDSAGLVAQRLIDRLSEPMIIDDHELVVTPSVGIAVAPRDADDVEGLLRAAGTAMYHAKASTRGDFLFYNEEMQAAGLDRLKLESDLRKAIERNELLLHYQPQVDIANGSIVGAEALLRWEHPEYGLIPPFRFIPLAEEIGLIEEFGDWVLVEVCRQMNEFREQDLELPKVAINVSPFQFNPLFINRVKEVLIQADLPASMLELGLSEGILTNNDQSTIKSLRELTELGVYLSVDNFGMSYAPLSYLGNCPLDELKIDRSFVVDCDSREESGKLVKAIISMANSLNLRIVAEGVETEGQYQFLSSNGARVMQGYLFSKPVPAEELKAQLVVPWHYMTQIQRIALTREFAS